MTKARFIEPFPKLDIFDGLFICRKPAALFPIVHPAGHAAAQILRIRMQLHIGRFGDQIFMTVNPLRFRMSFPKAAPLR